MLVSEIQQSGLTFAAHFRIFNMQIIKLTFSTILFFLLSNAICAQGFNDIDQVKVDVVYLASDYLEGRHTGSKGEKAAAQYIKNRFAELGLQPGYGDNYFQSFTFKADNPHNPHDAEGGPELTGTNVIAYRDNGAKETIAIGAHYDHLGHGETGAMDAHDKGIHNGADDNASGIAAMLYLAKQLDQKPFTKFNYLFMAFSGEEQGLHGSKAIVKDDKIDLSKIKCMMNMDMVGRLTAEKGLMVHGTGTSTQWNDILDEIKVDDIQKVVKKQDGIGPSDHTSFYLQDIPVLHFFTGQHSDYHKSTDDSQLVNFDGIISIGDYMIQIVFQLLEVDEMEFSKTKTEQTKGAKYKVTLGVMPDYSSEEKGMRIDAVLEGRPAQQAGIQDGDVIIELGGEKVIDIYGYMNALSKYEKGDKAKVIVKRGRETMEYEVTF